MATIMRLKIGGKTHVCNATCHKARHARCTCICGGHFHGLGSSDAAAEKQREDWNNLEATVREATTDFMDLARQRRLA